MVFKTYGNGLVTDYVYDGIDGVANPVGGYGNRRLIEIKHRDTSATPTLIDHRTFTWDKGNRLFLTM
jgi:hypothetical protein